MRTELDKRVRVITGENFFAAGKKSGVFPKREVALARVTPWTRSYVTAPEIKSMTGNVFDMIMSRLANLVATTVLGQKYSSDALFTPKVPIFTTLSHCTMFMRISENLSLH